MKKIGFLFLLICGISISASAQNTYYVSNIGSNADDGLSTATAWETIDYAVNNAADGSTIIVRGGFYSVPPLAIDKALTIQGEANTSPQISPASGNTTYLFRITASDVSIEGFVLEGNAQVQNAIITEGASVLDAVAILRNDIRNFSGSAILIGGGGVSNFAAQNNKINANATAVTVNAALGGIISENNLSGNGGLAVVNNTSGQVDASANWWGSEAYASVVAAKQGNVDINPWLRNGADIDISTDAGFQSLLTPLGIKKLSQNADVINEAAGLVRTGGIVFTYYTDNPSLIYNPLQVNKNFTLEGFANPSFPDTDVPVLEQIIADGASLSVKGRINLSGNAQDNNNAIRLTNGGGITASEGLVTLAADSQTDDTDGELIGTFRLAPQEVEANETLVADALGVIIGPGDQSLGQVSVSRTTGPSGITTFGDNQQFKSIAVRWTINVENQPGPSGRDLRLTWSSEFDNGIETADAYIWRKPEAGSDWELVTEGQLAILNSQDRSVLVSDVQEFSSWTISDVNNPLPVVLTNMSASLQEPHVRLDWQTASEVNSDFFAVERSTNGLDFAEIGRMRAAGDSQEPLDYTYIDEAAANRFGGSLFYRLRMVDFDASYEYSEIVTVFVDNDKVPMITAFRDLNDNAIHLLPRAIEDGTYRIRISDLSGRRIFEEEVKLEAGKPRRLGLENLSQSIYLLHAMGRQRVLSNKFKID